MSRCRGHVHIKHVSGGPFFYVSVGFESSSVVAGGLGAECIRGFGRTGGTAAGNGRRVAISLEFTKESHNPAAHRTLDLVLNPKEASLRRSGA